MVVIMMFIEQTNQLINLLLQAVIQMSKEWKTSNQQYGSHQGKSSSLPKKVGSSTLEYIKTFDKGNFIQEQQNIAQRFRHGLFSQPVGLATGDAYEDKKPDKPEKRVQVNNRMQQKVGPQLFSKLSSTNINDPYKDNFRAQQLYNLQKNALSIHPQSFMAGGKQKLVKHSEFQHNKQYDDKVYNTRDQTGKVKVGSKPVMTNNMKKGNGNTTVGHLFSDYPYMGSPFDANKQANSQQKLEHKAKIAQPFVGSSHPSKTFTPDYLVHQPIEPFQQQALGSNFRGKSVGNWKYNNPNKKGYNGTFEKFPQYIEQGQKEKILHPSEKIWLPNFNGTSKGLNQTLSKPCPVPSQLILNEMKRTSS